MGSNSRSPRTVTSSIGGTAYPDLRSPVNVYVLLIIWATLPWLIPATSALCSSVRLLQKDGGQVLHSATKTADKKDGGQARRFNRG